MKIYLTSLGCDKNLVDGEVMLDLIIKDGHTVTNDETDADAVVVNTCGFIKSATEESVETILRMAERKKSGAYLIVAGCMAERYGAEVTRELPEADAVIGTRDYETITEVISRLSVGESHIAEFSGKNTGAPRGRVLSAPSHYASLKIAEGCDNRCAYCVIPKLRGGYISRDIDGLVRETESLAACGVKEIMLVAQDTTLYGVDLYGEPRLPELIRKISNVAGVEWIRVLYAYPERVTDALIREMAANPKVCNYIDMPVQHADDGVLRRMGRRTTRASLIEKISALRETVPNVCIRSTVMAGFPGESEKEFLCLLDFIRETGFERLGAFAYSREEGTPAYKMPGQLPEKEKTRRKNECLRIQKEISNIKMKRMIGKTVKIIVDGRLPDKNVCCGRSYMDCPDVDGMVFFESPREIVSGTFADVKITGSSDYDLHAELIKLYD